jgi:hypothetical protein
LLVTLSLLTFLLVALLLVTLSLLTFLLVALLLVTLLLFPLLLVALLLLTLLLFLLLTGLPKYRRCGNRRQCQANREHCDSFAFLTKRFGN